MKTVSLFRVCKKCVLPEHSPDIRLNQDGICNICVAYQAVEPNIRKECLETDFVKIINKHKRKGEYDCLVMCSGGKDSISALYYMKKKYKLNPLVFTFDNGFEIKGAMDNIQNAVNLLGVDFMLFKSDYMKDMFREIVLTNPEVVICNVCSIWYMDLAYKMAARFNIPIIVAGWTKGQSTRCLATSKRSSGLHDLTFASMARITKNFLIDYKTKNLKYIDFPLSMEEVLKRAKKRHKSIVISPHWFLPSDSDIYTDLIKEELKWKQSDPSYPLRSTNCYLNFLSVHLSMKYYGYTHYHVEMSNLIRLGKLSREEALEMLEINFDENLISDVLRKINCSFEDLVK